MRHPKKFEIADKILDARKDKKCITFCATIKDSEHFKDRGPLLHSKKKKKDTLKAGKLYSLTKLQNVLGKKYKMSMEQSLQTVQNLYERGFVTYPRTNSEYLATAEKEKIKKVLEVVSQIGYPVKFKDGKTIFDDSKIESHSALTPTYKIPKKNELSSDEYNPIAFILYVSTNISIFSSCPIIFFLKFSFIFSPSNTFSSNI